MPARFPLPQPSTIRSLIADLVGRAVELERTTLDRESAPDVLVSGYETEAGGLGALVITDTAGAAVLGASLTAMPPAVVESVRRSEQVDDPTIIENLGEIANVLAQVFNSPDTPHLRWTATVALADIDEATRALLDAPAARRDLLVTVEGYGGGRLSVIVA